MIYLLAGFEDILVFCPFGDKYRYKRYAFMNEPVRGKACQRME